MEYGRMERMAWLFSKTVPADSREFQPVPLDHAGDVQNLIYDRTVLRGGQVDAETDGH
jgi:hypothetical protein